MILYNKIKEARKELGLTQQALEKELKLPKRSLSFYEKGDRIPSAKVIEKLCDYFQKPYEYFISSDDVFLLKVGVKFGSKGKKDAEKIIRETATLFAGGDLDQEDKYLFLKTMEAIYFDAKERAKKYAPKKYQSDNLDI